MTSSAPPPFSALPRHAQVTQIAAVSSLVALIVLCVAWELWLAPVRPGGSLLALKALPLVLPLPGLLKRRMYTYRWLSLMIWLYCTEGLVRAIAEEVASQRQSGTGYGRGGTAAPQPSATAITLNKRA